MIAAASASLVVVIASFAATSVSGAVPATPVPKAVATASVDPQALAAQSPNQPFALQLIQRFIEGTSTATDAQATPVATQIDQGVPLAQVVAGVATSAPAIEPDIEHAYATLLDRAPDAGGLAFFSNRVAAGAPLEWVYAAMANSPEFGSTNPTVSDRIGAVYEAMLDRAADPSGASYFASRFAAGLTAAELVAVIQASTEYGQITTNAAYQQLLLRASDPSGSAFWARIVNVSGVLAMRVGLGASMESRNFGCDPIAGSSCMVPWPNNYYTRPDAATATGLRLNLKANELPANVSGTHIDPTQLNRSDGFSPGSTLMLQIPGIDPDASGMPTLAHLDRNGPGSPVILYDTDAHTLVDTWSELDVHAPYDNPAQQLLLIHPVKNLTDGHHYVVGLRNLKNSVGGTLPAPPVFAAYRDGTSSSVAGFAQRSAQMDSILTTLGTVGFQRSSAFLAWDFTVASTANITGRLVHMRDDAFAQLGSSTPSFTVTNVAAGTQTGIARVVEGTYAVPNYLTGTGAPGSTFNEDSSGLPQRNGTFTATFRCVIPTSALTTPARASLYGHGLFGSVDELTAGNVQAMAAEHNMVFCGTNWVGMSSEDLGTAAGILGDLSGFDKLADRMQQAVLNFLFLGRLMKMSPGLASNAAFQNSGGSSVLAPGQLYYDGNSQGGIEGGVVTAVSTDLTRSVLGVSGMDYSLLLPRSTDFNQYEAVMKPAYPSELDRMLGLAAVQLEWDRAEPDGYANHMTTDPLPGTPQHQVLMQIALGDHQVTDYAADTMARTIGAKAYCPSFDPGVLTDTRLLWGIACIPSYPYSGSAIVYFDSGAGLPPLGNVAPDGPHDPHEDPRNDIQARNQKSAFLEPDSTSAVIDVCGGAPCHAAQS
ncbi:MAG: DUF4214 domain-containing protein [Actinobacteria bacterium]|nr:DUF4214 domain-containing protein [Actinomycetota bacterium]